MKVISKPWLLIFMIVLVLAFASGPIAVPGALAAGSQDIILVSSNSAKVPGNGSIYESSLSSDGRYVAFMSNSTNLVPGADSGSYNVYRKDLWTGQVVLCSSNSAGVPANGDCWYCRLSSDARYVAFVSYADNLVPEDTNGAIDIFRKDLSTGDMVRCSTSGAGVQGNGDSNMACMSSDGRYVSFTSMSSNLTPDTEGGEGYSDYIFRKDMMTGSIACCSPTFQGTLVGDSEFIAMSKDGRYIAFTTGVNLVSGDVNELWDVYRRDLVTGRTICCSSDCRGKVGNNSSRSYVTISADGRFVEFSSDSTNLVTRDNNETMDVFLKDCRTGRINCCSTNVSGKVGNLGGDCAPLEPCMSSDGRYVTFSSYSTNLVPRGTNGNYHVFRKDLMTGAVKLCSCSASGVEGDSGSGGAVISADGRYVFFSSDCSNLIPGVSVRGQLYRKDCGR